MKKIIALIICFAAVCFSCFSASAAQISMTDNAVNITEIPENGTVILALYSEKTLGGVKIYRGNNDVSVNYTDAFGDGWEKADEIKAFVWDSKNVSPICAAESFKRSDSSEKVGEFDLENRTVMLNSGYEMPILGIGTYLLSDTQAENSVYWALRDGYRLIDTARIYGNETGVGRGIKKAIDEGLVKREDIFVTTKMWTADFDNGDAAIDASLKRLGLDYIDLMILHHSQPSNDVKAYKSMEKAVKDGKLRSIGLSNYYTADDFDRLVNQTEITPALLQNETHPYHQSMEMKEHLKQYKTVMESWFPLGGRGNTQTLFNDETISSIAKAHNKTSAQVILRWHLQAGNIAIPGSSNESHIKENNDIFDFELSDDEMQKMTAIDKNQRFASY